MHWQLIIFDSSIQMNFVIVFPQFAKASDPSAETATLPQHGFARISKFKWNGTLVDSKSEVSVRFGKEKNFIRL
jgi:hypothetical protein